VRFSQFALGLFLSCVFIATAYPHGGGLDSYGCHHNRKAGGYHCHRGQFAGESFSSKDEMLQKLSGEKSKVPKESKGKD
jgi:hypothetical protein